MTVDTTRPTTAPIATVIVYAAIAPQKMPTRNSRPVSALPWNITCPEPLRLVSMNLSTTFLSATSSQGLVMVVIARPSILLRRSASSPPQRDGRNGGVQNCLSHQSPEITNLRLDGFALRTEDFEDETGVVR